MFFSSYKKMQKCTIQKTDNGQKGLMPRREQEV